MGQRFVGVLFAVIGLGAIAAAPVVSLRCAGSGPSSLGCRAERKILGLVPIGRLVVEGVTGAYVDVQDAGEPESPHRVQRLVLRTRSGETSLPGFSRRSGAKPGTTFVELASFDAVAGDISDLAGHPTAGVAEYRSFTWTPLLVGAGFLAFGILALWPAGRARRAPAR